MTTTDTGEVKGVSPQMLANEIGGSPGRFKKLFESGDIPGYREGKRIYFHAADVRAAIEEKGLTVKGLLPVQDAETAERFRSVEEIKEGAFKAAQEAAIAYVKGKIDEAEKTGGPLLQAALHRELADMLELLANIGTEEQAE